MVELADITPDLVERLAAEMRPADAQEVWLSHQHRPLEALQRSVSVSPWCVAAVDAEGPLAMFGVGSRLLSETGSPWMLGSVRLANYRREIARWSPDVVRHMRSGYSTLENRVLAANVASVRWLSWCGFTLEEPAPFGPFGALFRRFWMKGDL